MKNKFLCPRWGSNPRPPTTRAQKFIFTFYSIIVNCEELFSYFSKTNIKLLKLIKIKK